MWCDIIHTIVVLSSVKLLDTKMAQCAALEACAPQDTPVATWDYPGRGGWFPLIMLVHSFRTKMPVPDKHREGLFLLIRH